MCEIPDDMCASCRKALHKCHPINGMPSDRWQGPPLWLPERGPCLRVTGSGQYLCLGSGVVVGLSKEGHPFES